MTLTRDAKQTVIDRAMRDPAFVKALFDEVVILFRTGEPETARLVLRDLIRALIAR
ncbi:MAG: hypothetical protein JO036_15720 [Candidatus Eremiobacteraeota bacterium]|nr:hypothetical protein [Candidatus Eremiobacteraeota bacterium]